MDILPNVHVSVGECGAGMQRERSDPLAGLCPLHGKLVAGKKHPSGGTLLKNFLTEVLDALV